MNLTKPTLSNHPPPRFTVCHRHPDKPLTGFCADCLSERLAGVKSIIEETGESSRTSGLSGNHLSRSKSCSGHNGCRKDGIFTSVEPRRNSCDVRGRSSLSVLFDLDDDGGVNGGSDCVDTEIRVCGIGDEIGNEEDWRTMKEHIDLECKSRKQSKGRDLKNIAGSIWVAAASGFGKKLQKWGQKQKMRMRTSGDRNGGVGNLNRVTVGVERVDMNAREWRERETQSELGDYGFGRRSCDTEPRFSVDVRRAFVDCPRFSLDVGRASCDGYLNGRLLVHRPNQMLAVVEDDDRYVKDVMSRRSRRSGNRVDKSPGGTEQTRHYYGEALSRRRSLDRSTSNRRASSVELEELRAISNARISPATVELFHGAKVLLNKNDVKLPNLSPIKTMRVKSSDSVSIGPSSFVDEGNVNKKLHVKKLAGWRKAWTNWGLPQKQVDARFKFACDYDEEEFKATEKVASSDTHVSSNSSSSISGSFMRSSTELKGIRNNRHDQPLALEHHRSTKYSPSPSNPDNGLLRFYLTPSRGIRGGKYSKSRLKLSHDAAKNVLRL